jgi:hypothetical protein
MDRVHQRRMVVAMKHGTRAGYNRGCRCKSCTKASNDYHRVYQVARYRAFAVLAQRYPAEYRELLQVKLKERRREENERD